MKNNRPAIYANERTVASAGAGKTYTLTNRFIALARVYAPETIYALTFTRMTAGEFLDKILIKLADAATNDSFAEALSKDIEALSNCGKISKEEFLKLLKRIVEALPKLNLSTIDSFEMKFVTAFASELGMVGTPTLLDSFAIERIRTKILKEVLANYSADKDMFERFSTAVDIANAGKLKKNIFRGLSDYISSAHRLFCRYPYVQRWGNLSKIRGLHKIAKNWDYKEYERLRTELESFSSDDKELKKLLSAIKTFFKNSTLMNLYSGESRGVKFLRHLYKRHYGFETTNDADDSGVDLSLLTSDKVEVIMGLLDILIGSTISTCAQITLAVGAIVGEFERKYNKNVRMRGKISFEDLPILLTDENFSVERSAVEFRMDARYNHWLLDEFQDTSNIQWEVLSNLIEEVLLDQSGRRTLFYVGDKKQSIYGWRDANPDLFDIVFDGSNGAIRSGSPLNVSWRSSSPIIDMVNAVFESNNILNFGDSGNRWLNMWTHHKSHPKNGDNGCVMWVGRSEESDGIDEIYNIIKQVNPMKRGLSCAILVQRNNYAVDIIEGIKARAKRDNFPISIAGELDKGIATDNMVIPAILQFLQAVAHPLDSSAFEYVKMTPLKFLFENNSWRNSALDSISNLGFEQFCLSLAQQIEKICKDDFSKQRIKTLIEAAADFDSLFERNIDLFIEYIKNYKVRDTAKQSTIEVMSIHKSKGLDFDMVIMPQMEQMRSPIERMRLTSIEGIDNEKVIFNLPSRAVCSFVTPLENVYNAAESKNSLEDICVFYVGATRAKRAVYFIGKNWDDEQISKSKSKYSFDKHIYSTICADSKKSIFASMEVYVPFGSLNWFESESVQKKSKIVDKIGVLQNCVLSPIARNTLSPSALDSKKIVDSFIFNKNQNSYGADFGTVIHLIFEKITFQDSVANFQKSREFLKAKFTDDKVLESAISIAQKCFSNPEILKVFVGNFEEKREFKFSMIEEDCVVNGIFDRVNIYRNPNSEIEKIEVVDFKTDSQNLSDSELLSKYKEQMQLYRKAASTIFSVSEDCVICKILNVTQAKLIEVKKA